jgi:hypothetical protein
MPPWLEVSLDVLGFVGFIAIATLHRPHPNDDKPARS